VKVPASLWSAIAFNGVRVRDIGRRKEGRRRGSEEKGGNTFSFKLRPLVPGFDISPELNLSPPHAQSTRYNYLSDASNPERCPQQNEPANQDSSNNSRGKVMDTVIWKRSRATDSGTILH